MKPIDRRDNSNLLDLPVLPVRGTSLFPHTMMPLTVGRPGSIAAVRSLGEDEDNLIAVIAQRDPTVDRPSMGELYSVGTVARVLRVTDLPQNHGALAVFVEGVTRIRVQEQLQGESFLVVRAALLEEVAPPVDDPELIALVGSVRELFEEIVENAPNIANEILFVLRNIEDPSALADFIGSSLPSLSATTRQELLENVDVAARLRRLMEELARDREDQRLRNKIRTEVQEKISDTQRKFLLGEQLKAIKKELGEEEEEAPARELEDLRRALDEAVLPEEAQRMAKRELARLARISPMSPEHTVARTYLDWLASLPWQKTTGGRVDINQAGEILDEDHYDLEKVKDRILEYLAVLQLKQDLKGPILCLVGPPGVGKTSLGKSIARATGRKFTRMSLGGMRDEAEIRGHRRTYIGSMPGQIIQAIRRVGSSDAVLMLDEVDKLGRDFRGDPSSALLEVLDPEQNVSFRDHYLEVPFDLSKILFIATANVLDPVPGPLRDRMEIIELAGYIDEEKVQIARKYLVPRQITANGLDADAHIRFEDEALREIVHRYTHESGVRKLEQQIAAVCRKRAKQVIRDGTSRLVVTAEGVRELLGVPRFRIETEIAERTSIPGVAIGLAWTPFGGEILFVESARMPADKGSFSITGQVRPVMEESAQAALSWLRAHAKDYDIDPREFHEYDIHIHVPSGAVPKDGPSAGVVMVASLLSLFCQRPVRPYMGMTGEITLSGVIMPVGGIKEKVLAAKRSGIRELILPEENQGDVQEDIPPYLREGLTFHFVRTLSDALGLIFSSDEARPEQLPDQARVRQEENGRAVTEAGEAWRPGVAEARDPRGPSSGG